jgi:hypothetical protein
MKSILFPAIIILLFVFEIGFRCFYKYKYNTINLIRPDFTTAIYPEIKKIKPSHSYKTILVLGESVTEQTIFSNLLKNKLEDCLRSQITIDNLSKYANSITDSYYKFARINKHYDYVLVSHGLSDCRMNYNPYSLNKDYYYFSWEYVAKKIILSHCESSITVTPMTLHLIANWLFYIFTDYSNYVRKGKIKPEHVKYGKLYKNNCTFDINLDNIIALAKKQNEKVILLPIIIYIPKEYTEYKFTNDLLDYNNESGYPVEIYGDPENLEKIASRLKDTMREKENKYVSFYDIDISKDKYHFRDLCHLTENGIEEYTSILSNIICKE